MDSWGNAPPNCFCTKGLGEMCLITLRMWDTMEEWKHTHTHVHSKQWKATGWPCDTGIMPFGPILPPPTVSLDYKKWAAFTSQGLWPGHAQTMETTNYLHLSAKGTVQIFKNLKSSTMWPKRFPILCPPHLFSYLELEKEGREMKRKGGTQKSLALGSAPRR